MTIQGDAHIHEGDDTQRLHIGSDVLSAECIHTEGKAVGRTSGRASPHFLHRGVRAWTIFK
ncbi:hypothetical protein BKA82DRAFT_991480 [Pisolithus tinctorius]|uniref:Uncharacterized protein n=1 Tax=Pisolithus tinctorius Marx 270 TaxID=870435 RepID=A0A0C3PZB4_PISTI|nr:hypothetical protein BKA82DRAFT_991480 [Pisolithus tinctorius]KIO14729.1 hypothetical protein M404DRAFT_991480 [Pisolithus tinctorius Marx 270]